MARKRKATRKVKQISRAKQRHMARGRTKARHTGARQIPHPHEHDAMARRADSRTTSAERSTYTAEDANAYATAGLTQSPS